MLLSTGTSTSAMPQTAIGVAISLMRAARRTSNSATGAKPSSVKAMKTPFYVRKSAGPNRPSSTAVRAPASRRLSVIGAVFVASWASPFLGAARIGQHQVRREDPCDGQPAPTDPATLDPRGGQQQQAAGPQASDAAARQVHVRHPGVEVEDGLGIDRGDTRAA